MLLGAVYAVFGSVVWSAYQNGRSPLDDMRLIERAATGGRPGDLEAASAAPERPGVFPVEDVLRRAVRSSRDEPQMAIDPPAATDQEDERATLFDTARNDEGIGVPPPSGEPAERAGPVEPPVLARDRPVIETPLDDLVDLAGAAPERTEVEAPDARPSPAIDAGIPGGRSATAPRPSAEILEPAAISPATPSFKPLHLAAAVASAVPSSAPGGLDAPAEPRAATRVPPRPAFKPSTEPTDLAESGRGSSDRGKSPTVLGSFWSSLKALLDSPPRRVLLASGDGGGGMRAARSDARAGGGDDPPGDGGAGAGGGGSGTGRSDTGNDRGDDGGRGGDRGNDRDDGDRGSDRGDNGRGSDRGDDDGRGGDRGNDRGDSGRGSDRGDNGRGSERGDNDGRGGDRGDNGRGGDHGGGRGGDRGNDRGDNGRGSDRGDNGRGGDHGGRGGDHGGGKGGDHGGGRGRD